MSSQYLSEEANLDDLISKMNPRDQDQYREFEHLRVDPGYIGRIYVIYKATGLTKENKHRDPEILGQVKVIDWYAEARLGSTVVLEDMTTGETLVVDHVPRRLFEYDVFISVPPYQRVRFEGRQVGDTVRRSMLFSLAIKTRVRSAYYSKGVTFCEAPKGLRDLYPDANIDIKFI